MLLDGYTFNYDFKIMCQALCIDIYISTDILWWLMYNVLTNQAGVL